MKRFDYIKTKIMEMQAWWKISQRRKGKQACKSQKEQTLGNTSIKEILKNWL